MRTGADVPLEFTRNPPDSVSNRFRPLGAIEGADAVTLTGARFAIAGLGTSLIGRITLTGCEEGVATQAVESTHKERIKHRIGYLPSFGITDACCREHSLPKQPIIFKLN